jgi:hypothetical protein
MFSSQWRYTFFHRAGYILTLPFLAASRAGAASGAILTNHCQLR